MNVDRGVHWREYAAVVEGMKTDQGRLGIVQLEFRLDLLVLLHVVRCLADSVENMKADVLLTPAQQEGQGALRVEPRREGSVRNECFEIFERANCGRHRHIDPGGHLRPYQKRRTTLVTLAYLQRA